MADSLYVLAMVMTQPVTKFLSEEEFDSLQKAAIFIASIHTKSFLQSSKIELAPLNDFNQMKRLQKLIDCEIQGPNLTLTAKETIHIIYNQNL